MGQKESERQVRSWGFDNIFTWTDAPFMTATTILPLYVSIDKRSLYRSTHYPPHSHATLTTHLIIDGEMTLWYPREEDDQKTTYGVGSRVDVDAGRVHEVIIGTRGCTYVIGE
ncbi:hypothetical protein BGZ63DRAFT_401510 [Mariannaea sp. PMI_226]|nr:hypothetical protein BGZ63DRAFT_401510 [Mariannaea sp. PMI_226]